MCVVAFAIDAHPRHRLVLAGNRDEFFARPAAPLAAWDDASDIYAGRDLEAGGTWLGVARGGRWGVVTNVRDPRNPRPSTRSRGDLVAGFLRGSDSPVAYAMAVHEARDDYDGFNLVVGDPEAAYWVSTRGEQPLRLLGGVYGVSNDRLDTPWPKVVRARIGLREAVQEDPVRFDDLFALLDDRTVAPDDQLPDTGVGLDLERALSPLRILHGDYGTRVSTALTINGDGLIRMAERTWQPDGLAGQMTEMELLPWD